MIRPWISRTPKKIEWVRQHWSGKHHAVVEGINLMTLLWSDVVERW